jgi:hypothetical protein
LEEYEVRFENEFPPRSAEVVGLYLDASAGALTTSVPIDSSVSFASTSPDGSVRFVRRFERDTEITGPMALRCFMSTDDGHDMDVFVGIRKFDVNGTEVNFWNRLSRHEIVSHGWLRASRRPDPTRIADPLVPAFDGDQEHAVVPGEVIELNVEILPSSTLFEAGTSLVLEIKGRDVTEVPNFQHHQVFNSGTHTLRCGSSFPSVLLVPLIRRG